MASSMKKVRTVTVKKDVPDGVMLDLTHEEARVLKIILSRVAGHPGNTLRGYQNRISDALEDAGYRYSREDDAAIDGHLQFTLNTLDMKPTDTTIIR